MFFKSLVPAIAVLPGMVSAFGGLGLAGPIAPAPTGALRVRNKGTPVEASPAAITPEPTSSLEYSAKFGANHLNLLKARGYCSRKCEWDAFCVEAGGYGGCCDNRYTSCLVATTCVDYSVHQNQITNWDKTKTIMCPFEQAYCTVSLDNANDFTFVDCGVNPATKATSQLTTTSSTPTTTTGYSYSSTISSGSSTFASPSSTATDTATDADDGTTTTKGSVLAKTKKKGFSAGAGAGVGVGAVVLIAILFGLVMFLRKRNKPTPDTSAPPPQSHDPNMAQAPGYYPPAQYGANPPPPGIQEVYAPMSTKPQGSDFGAQGQQPNSYYAPSAAPSSVPGAPAQYYQPPNPGVQEAPGSTSYPSQGYSAPPPGEILVEAPGAESRR